MSHIENVDVIDVSREMTSQICQLQPRDGNGQFRTSATSLPLLGIDEVAWDSIAVRRSNFHAKRIPSLADSVRRLRKEETQRKVPGGWRCLALRRSRVQSMCRSGTAN